MNMSYCRFENTVGDMQDCAYELQEAVENGLSMDQFMAGLSSEHERYAVRRMLGLLQDMNEAIEALKANEGLTVEMLEELEA